MLQKTKPLVYCALKTSLRSSRVHWYSTGNEVSTPYGNQDTLKEKYEGFIEYMKEPDSKPIKLKELNHKCIFVSRYEYDYLLWKKKRHLRDFAIFGLAGGFVAYYYPILVIIPLLNMGACFLPWRLYKNIAPSLCKTVEIIDPNKIQLCMFSGETFLIEKGGIELLEIQSLRFYPENMSAKDMGKKYVVIGILQDPQSKELKEVRFVVDLTTTTIQSMSLFKSLFQNSKEIQEGRDNSYMFFESGGDYGLRKLGRDAAKNTVLVTGTCIIAMMIMPVFGVH